ncbi:DUF3168 domain-containing protein [Paenochrobactrum sp. BZR 201-1]
MSVSVAFQDLLLAKLKADPVVASLVGSRIWDSPPSSPEFPYITLGATDFTPTDVDCIDMREETVQIDVWTRANGRKWQCKQIVDAVVNVMRRLDGDLSSGTLIDGRIEIARVLDDPDGITTHGVVQFTGILEG